MKIIVTTLWISFFVLTFWYSIKGNGVVIVPAMFLGFFTGLVIDEWTTKTREKKP